MNDVLIETNEDPQVARSIQEIAPQLREATIWVKDIETELAEAKTLVTDLKDEMEAAMAEQGIRTAEADGLQIQLKYRSNNVIIDQKALIGALARTGMLTDFMQLDSTRAAKYGVAHGLPGAAEERKPYVSVKVVDA